MWLSWLQHGPVHQKVVGSIAVQGECLGFGFNPLSPGREAYEGPPIDVFLLHQCLSLSLN